MSPKAELVEHDIDVTVEQRAIKTDSPQDTLPDDILVHIFVLISQDHGPVVFPIRNHAELPQIVLSRVCSRWRTLALSTFKLWNNVFLVNRADNRVSLFYREWLLRAGSSPIELSLQFATSYRDDYAVRIIQDTVSYFKLQIRMLHVDLNFRQFKALSSFPNSILPHVEKIELDFDSDDDADETFSSAPIGFTRLRSVVLGKRHYLSLEPDVLNISLPWSQLRCLELHLYARDLTPVFDTLRQISLLQELHLCIRPNPSYDRLAPLTELTIPTLWHIDLELSIHVDDANMVIRNITCPALVELCIHSEWSKETYGIIKQQYNLQGLEGLSLFKPLISASSVLKDAPKVHRLWTRGKIIDDEAIAGLSNGTLGRYLRELTIEYADDMNRLLSMVEMRKRTVDRLIENGCNWKEMITVLRKVVVYEERRDGNERKCGYEARVDALKKVGITVKLPQHYMES